MKVKNKKNIQKRIKRLRRKKSTRMRVYGNAQRPRLTVYRSLKNIYCQIVDDDAGRTLVSCSTLDKELKLNPKDKWMQKCKKVGQLLGERAISKEIKRVCFDKNGFKYHGRVKALADSCRKAGLQF